MRKLGTDITKLVTELSPDEASARKTMRTIQVRERYKQALHAVYKDKAPLFLNHTNNVYIIRKEDEKLLIVYVDESIYAAELNAQRELIKLKLLELFNEEIDEFSIKISRGSYRNNHPYATEDTDSITGKAVSVALDEEEEKYVSNIVSKVEDQRVQKSLERAMTADLEWKKEENAKVYGKPTK